MDILACPLTDCLSLTEVVTLESVGVTPLAVAISKLMAIVLSYPKQNCSHAWSCSEVVTLESVGVTPLAVAISKPMAIVLSYPKQNCSHAWSCCINTC